MNPFRLFLTINKGKSYWRRKNSATIIVMIAFGILALLIAYGEFYGFNYFLKTLNESQEFKLVVITYSLNSLFAVIFALMVASSLITSPILFLKNREDNFLLSLPIKTTTIFSARFLGQLGFIGWTAFLFTVPITLAIGLDAHVSLLFYLISFISLFVFVVLAVSISNIILFLIIAATKSTTTKLITIISFLGVGFMLYALVRTVSPHNLETLIIGQATNQNGEVLNDLTRQFRFWPSTLYAESLIGPLSGRSLFNLSSVFLLAITAVVTAVQYIVAKFTYRMALQITQENHEKISKKNSPLAKMTGMKIYIIKEWLEIYRTKSDRNQFLLFIALFCVYIGFIFNSPNLTQEPDKIWTPRIIYFILMTITYFIVLLALRFTFPFGSSEKHKFWYNLTLPLVRCRAFFSHIIASFLPTIIIIELIILLTAKGLHLTNSFTLPLLIIIPVICLTIITLTASIGTLIPVSHDTSSESMSTTPSGLLAFVLCIIYSTLAITALWYESKIMINSDKIGINMGNYYIATALISMALIVIFWKIGKDAYKRLSLG